MSMEEPKIPFVAFPKSYAGAYLHSRPFIQKCTDRLPNEHQKVFNTKRSCNTRAFTSVCKYLHDKSGDAQSAAEFLRASMKKDGARVVELSGDDVVSGSNTDMVSLLLFAEQEAQIIFKENTKANAAFLQTVLPKPYDRIETALGVPEADAKHMGEFTIQSLLRCFEGTILSTTNFTVASIAVAIDSALLTQIPFGKEGYSATDFIRIKGTGEIYVILHLALVLKLFRKLVVMADNLGTRGDDVTYSKIPEWHETYPLSK